MHDYLLDARSESVEDGHSFELGGSMSVCIAAIAENKKIIAVTDRKVSSIEFSNEDATVKMYPINDLWFTMYAGNDVSPCIPIVTEVSHRLINLDNTLSNVRKSFEDCYQKYLSNLATSKFLGRWQLTMEKFLEVGRKRFGADIFDNLCAQIEQVKLQCQFLVAGCDENGMPHIFVVRNPGCSEVKDVPGYWAIGNGDFAAMSTLGYLKQSIIIDWPSTIYNVWAAKFMAEKASEVGELSFAVQYGADGKEDYPDECEEIARVAWEAGGKPSAPQSAICALEELWSKREAKQSAFHK